MAIPYGKKNMNYPLTAGAFSALQPINISGNNSAILDIPQSYIVPVSAPPADNRPAICHQGPPHLDSYMGLDSDKYFNGFFDTCSGVINNPSMNNDIATDEFPDDEVGLQYYFE